MKGAYAVVSDGLQIGKERQGTQGSGRRGTAVPSLQPTIGKFSASMSKTTVTSSGSEVLASTDWTSSGSGRARSERSVI
jgi:hypothetical protein